MIPRRLALLHSSVVASRHFPAYSTPLAAQTLSTSSVKEGKSGGDRKRAGSRERTDSSNVKETIQSMNKQQLRTAVKKVAEEIEPGSNAGQSRFDSSPNTPTIIRIVNFRVTTTLIKRLDQLEKERHTAASEQAKWVEQCLGAMKDFLSATKELSSQENITRGPARANQVRRLVSKTGVALRSEAYERLKLVGLSP